MNNKGTLKHHINQTRGKCEASLQAIMSIAKHRERNVHHNETT